MGLTVNPAACRAGVAALPGVEREQACFSPVFSGELTPPLFFFINGLDGQPGKIFLGG
jgi:hypothetical protein